ncbi:hypothetical protein [Flavobacterium aquicola]|uniref:Lipoprotein n=1 Tax=Flavobacterium aquicola TaxID=1682742 RepID=A0A3E0EQP5_9FLAO|nr:hypothetical protein [Flavobacterium aquicola]REH00051.1 hypothetical protein C8P67_10318 [Flavobacterium aquicola]
MIRFFNSILILLLLSSCQNKIETNTTLSNEDLQRIKNIKLLEKDEKIIQFYSEFKNKIAGNFYTNKRIASYWLDERDTLKNKVEFAYFKDIIKLEPFYKVGLTYCPYILVTKSNNETFKVCVDGTEKEKQSFYVEAVKMWKKNK